GLDAPRIAIGSVSVPVKVIVIKFTGLINQSAKQRHF
ncbi:MAG: hypothetical protein ACI83E_003112, partial [Sulfitobacter sp.]